MRVQIRLQSINKNGLGYTQIFFKIWVAAQGGFKVHINIFQPSIRSVRLCLEELQALTFYICVHYTLHGEQKIDSRESALAHMSRIETTALNSNSVISGVATKRSSGTTLHAPILADEKFC